MIGGSRIFGKGLRGVVFRAGMFCRVFVFLGVRRVEARESRFELWGFRFGIVKFFGLFLV